MVDMNEFVDLDQPDYIIRPCFHNCNAREIDYRVPMVNPLVDTLVNSGIDEEMKNKILTLYNSYISSRHNAKEEINRKKKYEFIYFVRDLMSSID